MRALSERLSTYCAVAAGTCLMAIVVLTTLNIIFRRTSFLPPITGAQEGAAFLGALAVALALPFTQVRKANICVEMLQPYLSERARVLVERANGFISAIVCLLIAAACLNAHPVLMWTAVAFALLDTSGPQWLAASLIYTLLHRPQRRDDA